MTNREFYNAVANAENLSDELRQFAEDAIAKLDAKNEKRRNSISPKQAENIELSQKILEYLKGVEEFTAASVIGESLGLTPSKASSLCGKLVADGKLAVEKIKSTSKSGGKINGYKLA